MTSCRIEYLMFRMKRIYRSYENYSRFNLYTLFPEKLTEEAPEFYVLANYKDLFGFQEGSKTLVEWTQARGIHTDFVMKEGKHCTVDSNWLAQSLLP